MIEQLIYLWTRDAQLPINEETEEYIVDHLKKLADSIMSFSDLSRRNMAVRIIKKWKGI